MTFLQTQASFMEIFHNDTSKIDKLNEILCAKAKFRSCYTISTQTVRSSSFIFRRIQADFDDLCSTPERSICELLMLFPHLELLARESQAISDTWLRRRRLKSHSRKTRLVPQRWHTSVTLCAPNVLLVSVDTLPTSTRTHPTPMPNNGSSAPLMTVSFHTVLHR